MREASCSPRWHRPHGSFTGVRRPAEEGNRETSGPRATVPDEVPTASRARGDTRAGNKHWPVPTEGATEATGLGGSRGEKRV